jgi:UDP-N-acetylglucosamine/UDP-N-acetylgalactosamine diphosphorylase
VDPTAPNAVKLETFVFDALPLARSALVLEARREEVFSPVKNTHGADSVETARRDLNRRAARWLEAGGVAIPRRSDGEPDGRFEISPLLALDSDELRTAWPPLPRVDRGASVYLE